MPAGVIVLSKDAWEDIEARLRQEYVHTPSVMLVRSRMKEVLGFTPRFHNNWIEFTPVNSTVPRSRLIEEVHLDFFNPALETFFRLKYLNISNDSN